MHDARGFDLSEQSASSEAGSLGRVLVVDDYPAMSRLLRRILQGLGFQEIDQAKDGTTALVKLREQPYDLVFSDLNMEPMSGIDLLREVRSDAALEWLPFIIVTGTATSGEVAMAQQAGVDDYIIKPFSTDTVRKKIALVLGKMHANAGASPWPLNRDPRRS